MPPQSTPLLPPPRTSSHQLALFAVRFVMVISIQKLKEKNGSGVLSLLHTRHWLSDALISPSTVRCVHPYGINKSFSMGRAALVYAPVLWHWPLPSQADVVQGLPSEHLRTVFLLAVLFGFFLCCRFLLFQDDKCISRCQLLCHLLLWVLSYANLNAINKDFNSSYIASSGCFVFQAFSLLLAALLELPHRVHWKGVRCYHGIKERLENLPDTRGVIPTIQEYRTSNRLNNVT
uniref:Uncharacterized protein n=1 Tax=Arundo donax TaxID=35708 RepID=A0A0A9CKV4_ARUDO